MVNTLHVQLVNAFSRYIKTNAKFIISVTRFETTDFSERLLETFNTSDIHEGVIAIETLYDKYIKEYPNMKIVIQLEGNDIWNHNNKRLQNSGKINIIIVIAYL
ncbi:hypothetical protein [Alkalihalobacterium chitinilyticum]|uniref:Uncharacterized protein n=1 Tax=Alkalihalobacterium chitinilyticum TaxID=2980103 RepID=A0ABT5VF10_9BACI|nr:hypothetical protein [Alkalihalobacterium chitinilyticum]MDE5414048.1 hypothetical protein [Alkalihalobacterium chitinilyticum]